MKTLTIPLTIHIKVCDECPHKIVTGGMRMDWCLVIAQMLLLPDKTIPDWCPLEDAEDDNK